MPYSGNPTGSLKDLLIASTVGGFGLSMGRDAYKRISRNLGLIVAAIILAGGTAYGVWNLVRGHAKPSILRTIGCLLLAAASIVCTWFILVGYVFADSPGGAWTATLMTICLQSTIAVVAGIVGWVQRGKRVKGFAVGRHNEDFMRANGLRDVGGKEQTMLDGLGNELKLLDIRTDAIVFKVPGRRMVRAKILLDGDGRMVGYEPPQAA